MNVIYNEFVKRNRRNVGDGISAVRQPAIDSIKPRC